jgi:hypothetical protein
MVPYFSGFTPTVARMDTTFPHPADESLVENQHSDKVGCWHENFINDCWLEFLKILMRLPGGLNR